MYSNLIAVAELSGLIESGSVCVVDCRFNLSDKVAGRLAFEIGHIPGAVYADLEQDLSAPPNGACGRHPLPGAAQIAEVFSRLGISNDAQVVLYDDAGGMIAARGWWMLRYLGHRKAAVLDGGWNAWQGSSAVIETVQRPRATTHFSGVEDRERLAMIGEITAHCDLVDAREPKRYRGEMEPLDPRAGHIPGAKNYFFQGNLDDRGFFLQPTELRRAFIVALGKLPSSETVHYCGSGVSACHNILAQVYAGLDEPRLYCGSWSEWCADPERPAAHGDA